MRATKMQLTNNNKQTRLDLVNENMLINIYQAKTQLSKLIELAQEGKEVIIAKAGNPVAKIVKYKKKLQPRQFGLWKGKVFVPDNFDDEDEEINKLFYEGEIKPK